LLLALASAARADVLCASASGAVRVRVACAPNEHPLNLAALGLVGPKGDKGDPGAQGPPGAAGAPGASGAAARSDLDDLITVTVDYGDFPTPPFPTKVAYTAPAAGSGQVFILHHVEQVGYFGQGITWTTSALPDDVYNYLSYTTPHVLAPGESISCQGAGNGPIVHGKCSVTGYLRTAP
jgi:hypothetical protein